MTSIANVHSDNQQQRMTSPLYPDPAVLIAPGLSGNHPNSLKSTDLVQDRQKMVQAGQQFEAYFVTYLLKVMRETVPEGAIANKQGAYFYSFYDEEIGRRAAESGGIGIARMVEGYAEKYFSDPLIARSSFPVRDR